MKKFKHVLFWCVVPITFIVLLVADTMQAVSGVINNVLHKFEDWCFNYSSTHTYLGDGIWTDEDRVIQKEETEKVYLYKSYPKEHHEFLKELAEVFGDQWEIWYHSKHPLLGYITPYQEITYISGGLDKVKQIVNSIKHGGVV